MRRPLLALAACMLAGSLAPPSDLASVPWVLALVGFCLALVFVAPAARAGPVALAVCAFAVGGVGRTVEEGRYEATPLHEWAVGLDGVREPVLLRGALSRDPDDSGDRWVLLLDVDRLRRGRDDASVEGRARIIVDGDATRPDLVAGQRVSVWARVAPPRGFLNPGGFDSVAFARRRGIHAIGFCKSPLLVAPERSPASLRLLLGRVRARMRDGIVRHVEGRASRAVTRAMVLGDRTGLDDEIEDAFRIAGTYHVLALSGAQVALIAGLFVGLMRLLRCGALATAVATSLAVGAYALLVGADPPVTRAAWMATAVLFGHAAGLGGEAANLLGLAGILLLGLQPSSAADASFQLSFAATLGILLWAVPLSSCLRRLPRVLTLPLAASLAAQLALAPLLVWHFHRLAPAALLLNLIAVPLSSAVLLGGAVTAVLDLVFTPLAAAAGWGTTWAAWGLLKSAVLAEWLPGTHVRLPDPSALAVACWLATIVCLTRRRLGWVAAWGVLMLAAFMAGSPPQGDGRLHLTALDVGDGDALVLRSPLGRTWLLDAPGGRPGGMNLGEAVVAPYLWHLGLTELDRVSYTHGHRDHAGGIPFLMQSFKVGSVIVGSAQGHGLGTMPGHGSPRRRLGVCRGWRDMWDGVEVNVLWPPCDPSATESLSENDRSMVVRLRYGQTVILLTGDAGREVEPDVPADVLKVGHHGRRTSSSPDFVRGVSPRVAVISVGRHGPQGPPHDVVLAELRRVGAVVLRTDASGAVTVSTDGERVWGRGERYPHGRVTLRRPRALPRE